MPTRVMLVGLGPIGAGVARQLMARRIFRLVAAVDIDPDSDLGTRSRDNIEIIRQMQEAEMPDLGSGE